MLYAVKVVPIKACIDTYIKTRYGVKDAKC